MRQMSSKVASMVIGLMLALTASGAIALGAAGAGSGQDPAYGPGPGGAGAMMRGRGGPDAMRCEGPRSAMQRHGGWGGGKGAWKHAGHHRNMDHMLMRMMGALKLTDDQRNKVMDVLHTTRMKVWTVRGDIMDAQYKMRELYRADQPDPRKVGEAFARISNFRRQILEIRIRARNDIWNLLTKEQQTEVHNWKHGQWQRHRPASGGRQR